MDQNINDIFKTIDGAINGFQQSIPGIQKIIIDELQPLIKEMEISNGRLLNNVNNLKLIGAIKNKLQKIIVSSEYKDAVSEFVNSFDQLASLHIAYFSQFIEKFTPGKVLPLIQSLAIETTVNDLIGQGMKASVVDPIMSIITQNTTTGGSYADFNQQLRNEILNGDAGDGSLVRYTKQITTDAINQFSAQYTAAIAQDLKFEWMQYVGSLITTSRELCIFLTQKRWIHKSELPDIISGLIDGHQCKLSKTTKLPLGMIPGTTPENFQIRRGGYLCGHQAFWVPNSSVPKDLLAKFAAGKSEPVKPATPPPVAETKKKEPTEVPPVKKKQVATGPGTTINLQAYDQNFKDLTEIQNVLLHPFNSDLFNQYFTNTKFKTLRITRKSGRNGETDMAGNISLSPKKADLFISGTNKIKNGLDMTHDEEKAYATFWHEVWHNTNKANGSGGITTTTRRYMELGNEFVARKTLDQIFEIFGTKLIDKTLKVNRNDTGYNAWVKNYDYMIKFFKADPQIVLAYMMDKMKNGDYASMKTYLIEALMAGNSNIKKSDAAKAVKDCIDYGDWGVENVAAYKIQ